MTLGWESPLIDFQSMNLSGNGIRPAVGVLGAAGAAPLGACVEELGGVEAQGAVRQ